MAKLTSTSLHTISLNLNRFHTSTSPSNNADSLFLKQKEHAYVYLLNQLKWLNQFPLSCAFSCLEIFVLHTVL